MTYQPRAEDYDKIDTEEEYKPSAEDYEENESKIAPTPFNQKNELKSHPKERSGLAGLGSDVSHLFSQALKSGTHFLNNLKPNIKSIGKEFQENPWGETKHAAGQIGVGLGNTAKDIGNFGLSLLTPLSELGGIPEGGHPFEYQIPENTGLQEALGLQSNKKGDELLKEIPDIAALTTGLYGIGKSGAKYLSKTLPQGAEKIRRNAMTEAIINSAKEHGASKEELKALQDSLAESFTQKHRTEPGSMTPSKQRQKADIKEGEIQALQESANIPEKHVGEIPPKPDTKAMLEEHQDLIEKAKAEAEAEVGIKTNPTKQVGRKIKGEIEALEKSTGEIYDAARDHYKDQNVMADNSAEIKAATSELEALKDADELAPGYGSGTPEQKALQENIDALKGEKVKASDVFTLMRTSQQLANKIRMMRKGTTESEWQRLTKIADNLEGHAAKLGKRLEEVGGQDVKAMIQQANKGYRTFKELTVGKFEKGVFKTNPVSKEAFKTGNVSSQALLKLADELPGNQFLNKLVESDPELRKNVLAAYSGESNINKLTNPSSLTKKYIESLPEVEDKLNAFQNALREYRGKEKEAAKIDKAHSELVKSMKDAAKEQKIRSDAIKDIDRLKAERKSHLEASEQLEKKIAEVKAKGGNTDKLEEDFARHKREYNDKGTRMDKLKKIALKYATAKLGYESIVHKNND